MSDWIESLFEYGLPVLAALFIIFAMIALPYLYKEDRELRERYINLCVMDAQRDGMAKDEAVERCEVAWEMNKKVESENKKVVPMVFYIPR